MVIKPDPETQTQDLLSQFFLVTFFSKPLKALTYYFALFLNFFFIWILTFLVNFFDGFFLCKVCLSAFITERFGQFLMDCVKENINLRNEMRTRTVFLCLLGLSFCLIGRLAVFWGKTSSNQTFASNWNQQIPLWVFLLIEFDWAWINLEDNEAP